MVKIILEKCTFDFQEDEWCVFSAFENVNLTKVPDYTNNFESTHFEALHQLLVNGNLDPQCSLNDWNCVVKLYCQLAKGDVPWPRQYSWCIIRNFDEELLRNHCKNVNVNDTSLNKHLNCITEWLQHLDGVKNLFKRNNKVNNLGVVVQDITDSLQWPFLNSQLQLRQETYVHSVTDQTSYVYTFDAVTNISKNDYQMQLWLKLFNNFELGKIGDRLWNWFKPIFLEIKFHQHQKVNFGPNTKFLLCEFCRIIIDKLQFYFQHSNAPKLWCYDLNINNMVMTYLFSVFYDLEDITITCNDSKYLHFLDQPTLQVVADFVIQNRIMRPYLASDKDHVFVQFIDQMLKMVDIEWIAANIGTFFNLSNFIGKKLLIKTIRDRCSTSMICMNVVWHFQYHLDFTRCAWQEGLHGPPWNMLSFINKWDWFLNDKKVHLAWYCNNKNDENENENEFAMNQPLKKRKLNNNRVLLLSN